MTLEMHSATMKMLDANYKFPHKKHLTALHFCTKWNYESIQTTAEKMSQKKIRTTNFLL